MFKAYEKGNILILQEAFDKAISVDRYLQNRAAGLKPPKRRRRKPKDISSDEVEGGGNHIGAGAEGSRYSCSLSNIWSRKAS